MTELLDSPLSFSAAIRRMGGFVLVVLAHSTQRLFYGGCSRCWSFGRWKIAALTNGIFDDGKMVIVADQAGT